MRILIVEDNEKVAGFIAKGLRENRYAVDVALTGMEGASMARVGDYDAVILDVMLPGRNGFEVAEQLRERGISTPILMLTAKDQVKDKVQGLDAGADDYLVKPFAFPELLARLRALLRRRDQAPGAPLRIADLELDPVVHRVTRGGREIELTVREFAILDFLLRNRGRVVTRTAIIEHVWDMHFDSDTNLVDVHVSNLRRKIESDGDSKLIHTVRGVGYVLKEE